MHAYSHIRNGNVDWAHHDGITRAEWHRTAEFDASILDAGALYEAARLANRGQVVEAGTFLRAYDWTRRAIEIEDRDRIESLTRIWREREVAR